MSEAIGIFRSLEDYFTVNGSKGLILIRKSGMAQRVFVEEPVLH